MIGLSALPADASASSQDTRRLHDFSQGPLSTRPFPVAATTSISQSVLDLSGEWEIQEEERTYRATLDKDGQGPYTWQGGHITTTRILDRMWQGTWQQTGNDREGAFEILLSEDGMEAKGVWWYTRVGDRTNIPPKQWGGPYLWKRLSPNPSPGSR